MTRTQQNKQRKLHRPLKSHALRHKIANRDGWVCCFCQRLTECTTCNPEATVRASLDHILPRAHGGTNAFANLQIACMRCNEARGTGAEPSIDEFERLNDAGTPVSKRGWQRKREQPDDADNPEGCCKHTSRGAHRRPRRVWPTEEDAQAQADLTLLTSGVLLEPWFHRRCERWHLGKRRESASASLVLPVPVTSEREETK